ncbi:MAG TPA: nuclease-related domain-containing protein [Bacillales bacterium]|nr:nuclease-related domain-containing protein [Bacillales bacterium]
MAQLIKLDNYISRYETDIYGYPGRFIQIKKQRWETMKKARETEQAADTAASQDEWKTEFAEDVFFFQLRWASSTLQMKSDLSRQYRLDRWLKFFLTRFPDNYLILYKPVFQIQKAEVELDILMLSPVTLWCITLLESRDGTVFQGRSGRFWRTIENGKVTQTLNPLIANLRMYRLVTDWLKRTDGDVLPVRRALLSPSSFIEYPDAPGDVDLIDRTKARVWYEEQRKWKTPLKYVQLKTADRLLRRCQTVADER